MKPFTPRLTPLAQLFDWTPLIDISFLLLIFLIVTTTSTYPKALHLAPIHAHTRDLANLSLFPITIDKQHVIYVGEQQIPIEISGLAETLDQVRKERDITVTLNVDRTVDSETLITLLALLHAQNIPIQVLMSDDASTP